MSLSKGVDILQGLDKAETGRGSGDPIMRKLRITLLDGRKKYSGSKGSWDLSQFQAPSPAEPSGDCAQGLEKLGMYLACGADQSP
jgi:hypothetical protein